MCASAGSLAEALAGGVQVEDTAVFQWSNAFFLKGLGLSLEISEQENINCDFTCTSGYVS